MKETPRKYYIANSNIPHLEKILIFEDGIRKGDLIYVHYGTMYKRFTSLVVARRLGFKKITEARAKELLKEFFPK